MSNKDGWIRHRGGKCPVEKAVRVDFRLRNGVTGGTKSEELIWRHYKHESDIMAYRVCEPAVAPADLSSDAMEQCAAAFGDSHAGVMADVISRLDSPLQWRDRIREIDTTSEALEVERAELLQKLADEGLALLRVDGKVAPKEVGADMSDWRNWRVGDFIECALDTGSDGIKVGGIYQLTGVSDDSFGFRDDDGDARDRADDYCFKFHYRP